MSTISNSEDSEGKNEKFLEKLESLHCPFTWNMDDFYKTFDFEYTLYEEREIPLWKLMNFITMICSQTKAKYDLKIILDNLKKCKDILKTLRDEPELTFSLDVVNHVLSATECYVYWNYGKKDEAYATLAKVKEIDIDNKFERSTINACQSICWSNFILPGSEHVLYFIKKAIDDNSKCALWYFLLGKILRVIRREMSYYSKPTAEEKDAFKQAYKMCQVDLYGIFVAQMFREECNNVAALTMYKQIYQNNPKSSNIYLRLALGFMQLRKLDLAERCLNKVAEEFADDSMYLHYRGMYYIRIKDFRNAEPCLKKSADAGNYMAAKMYLQLMIDRIDRNFDSIQFLNTFIDKNKHIPEKQVQNLITDLALCHFKKHQIPESINNFVLAIEMESSSKSLMEFRSLFNPGKCMNVYKFLGQNVFPAVDLIINGLEECIQEKYEKLKNYYKEYVDNQNKIK